jgi:uncharacterized protein YqhQ
MNTEKFKIFVEALEALPEEIKNNEVDMRSNFEPVCGTAGCFAGLISIKILNFSVFIMLIRDLRGTQTLYLRLVYRLLLLLIL